MVRKFLYATLATVALAGTPACTGLEKTIAEQSTQKQTQTKGAIEKEVFFTSRNVLEERAGKLSVLYVYKNGIEAAVTYRKNEELSEIYIDILADPNNVLVKGTIVQETPDNCSYHMMIDGDKVKKAISFGISTNRTVSVLLVNGTLEYVKVSEQSKGKAKVRDYEVPELLKPLGKSHLRRIEGYLDLSTHQRILNTLPNLPKTECF